MEKLIVFFAAIILVIMGARGSYKAIWNAFFPNEQIVTTPVNTQLVGSAPGGGQPGGGGGQPGGPLGPIGTGNVAPGGPISPANPTYNPVAAGAAAASALQQKIRTINTGGSTNAAPHVVPAPASVHPVASTGRTQEAVLNTGIPSWWPSWLAWPGTLIGYYPGEGQTGQSVKNPFAP